MELFDNNTETENKNTIQNLSSYELYLNAKGRALYSNGSRNQQDKVLQNNGKPFLINLKACTCSYVRLDSGLYYVSKAEIFKNAINHKIQYKIVKGNTNNDFYFIVY